MISFVIIEMQTDEAGATAFTPPVCESDEAEAWSKYYITLSYAIRSSVYSHTVMLLTTDGRLVDSKNYVHLGAADS